MVVLYAPDSYGGFLSAPAACARVAAALGSRGLRVRPHPMADGGEGTLDALAAHRPVARSPARVPGPYGVPVEADLGRAGDVAFVESALAIGLVAAGDRRDPLAASSAGLGALLRRAAEGDGPVIVGLGGSATVDAGLGALLALGLRAEDRSGQRLPTDAVAADVARVARLTGPPPLPGAVVQVLADVRTPFHLAPARFGPQKGLAAADVAPLTAAFRGFGAALSRWREEQGGGPIDPALPGGGAAGGLGLALAAALDAPLLAGAEAFARLTRLDDAMADADVVVIGEGRLDPTSYEGKVAEAVSRRARARGLPVVALVGQIRDAPPPPLGPDAVFVAGDTPDRESAWEDAVGRLADALARGGLEVGGRVVSKMVDP